MTPGAYRFRPRWWGVLLAAGGCAAGIALGQWQSGRAETRRAVLASIEAAARAPAIDLPAGAYDPASLVRHRVAATGEFLPNYTVLLDYRMHRGRPGYHVVQPLRLAGRDEAVIVLRGWIAARANREDLPPIVTPRGVQRIEGLALERLPQYLDAGPQARCPPGGAACVWQNLSREKFAAWSGISTAPVLIEQTSALADGLDRDWERAETGYLKNEMYALQWYSLAALSAVLFIVLSIRRRPPNDGPAAG